MMSIHPNFLERDGKKAFAVLPYEEFQQMQDDLEDYEDLRTLRAAKYVEAKDSVTPLSRVREELDI